MKIIFICHGNICRSPMAEYIFKFLLEKNNINDVEVISRATSLEEIGNDIYPPAKQILKQKGILLKKHYAKRISLEEFLSADYIYVMDSNNLFNLKRLFGNNIDYTKVFMLNSKDVLDPWYTDNFEQAYNEIHSGCVKLLDKIKERSVK